MKEKEGRKREKKGKGKTEAGVGGVGAGGWGGWGRDTKPEGKGRGRCRYSQNGSIGRERPHPALHSGRRRAELGHSSTVDLHRRLVRSARTLRYSAVQNYGSVLAALRNPAGENGPGAQKQGGKNGGNVAKTGRTFGAGR